MSLRNPRLTHFYPGWILAVLGTGDALFSEMHPEERGEAGGAVRGEAGAGLVPAAGDAGHGAQPPVQVSHSVASPLSGLEACSLLPWCRGT